MPSFDIEEIDDHRVRMETVTGPNFDMNKRIEPETPPEEETPLWAGALAIVVIILVITLFAFLSFGGKP